MLLAPVLCLGWVAGVHADDGRAAAGTVLGLLKERCVQCHPAQGAPSGGIRLAGFESASSLTSHPDLISDILKAVDTGIMPPPGVPPLAAGVRDQVVSELRSLLRVAVSRMEAIPQAPIRRMNRFQYNNAVQDLLELRVDVFALPERMVRDYGYFSPASGRMPQELEAGSRPLGKSQLIGKRLAGVSPFPQDLRAEHGYDNRADHLTLSPLLLESFLKLGQSIVQSEDFNALTSGAWDWLFAPPPDGSDAHTEVTQVLRRFLRRAFRGPVTDAQVARYAEHVVARIQAGQSHTEAMLGTVAAVLASPRFLYLYERGAEVDQPQQIGDYELASRLSFFLWGSIPDEQLLDLAAERRLGNSEVLRGQVDRMLRDPRLKRFCDSFPSQWLQMERIVASVPDRDRFPDFYFAKFRTSMHMMLEPLLLFETVLIEDRPILELVDADYSYRSELLESWYRDGTRPEQVPPVKIPFRRVDLDDRRQGGVITNAAVMTMTSGPLETRPITRGAWLASVIFKDPPDPPPVNVPLLPHEADGTPGTSRTLRERIEAHRTQPECVSCHARIDPLGFALENYGPTGVWRDAYANGRAVDPAGVLFGTHGFGSVVEFKDAVLAEKDRFARAFGEHLLEFALARAVEVSDEPALDLIVRRAAEADYRMREMLLQVVLSEPFRRKQTPPDAKGRET